jgi:hypothetical protein
MCCSLLNVFLVTQILTLWMLKVRTMIHLHLWALNVFGTNFLDFVKNILLQIPFFLRKKSPEKRTSKNHPKLSQLTTWNLRTLDFLISYFEYHQIWLNILMDDHHLSNITKKNEKKKPLNCGELCFTYWPKHVIIGHVVYNLSFAFLCITSDNRLIDWWKNKLISWKLSSTWMKILNDMTWTLNWIELRLNWSIFKFNSNSIEKKWDPDWWRMYWKSTCKGFHAFIFENRLDFGT